MSKTTITVTTVKPVKKLREPAKYEKDGQTHLLTKFGKLVEIDTDEFSIKVQDAKGKAYDCMRFSFASTLIKDSNPHRYRDNILEFSYDEKNVKDKDIIKWWLNHPHACVDGVHPKSGVTRFIVTDKVKSSDIKIASYKERLKVTNKVSEMKKLELDNVMYLFGKSPIDKSKDQIVLELTEPTEGILMSNDNLALFVTTFLEGKNDSKDISIAINKAITLKVINYRDFAGNKAYYWNDNMVGTTENAVRDYFVRNDPMFKSMCAQLDRESGTTEEKSSIPANATPQEALEKNKMIDALNKAKKKNHPAMKDIGQVNFLGDEQIVSLYNEITKSA